MAGFKTFVDLDILTAAEVNGFLMSQAVMVFDDAAARSSALPSPTEGMVTYLKDSGELFKFDGAAYVPIISLDLDDLGDVDAGAPTDGQVLGYNDGDSKWEPVTPVTDLDDLGDVDAGSPSDGQVLTYNNTSGKWEAATPAAAVSPIGLILALGG